MGRKLIIAPGEYYHIYNRGTLKRDLFLDERDWLRFLFLILHFQSPITIYNLGRHVSHFVQHKVFNIYKETIDQIVKKRYFSLVAYCLMPNHFHLLIKNRSETGIPRYMQRTLNAYAKYFNAKYQQSGHLFQNVYQAVHVGDNRQLLHLSAYIHKNPLGTRKDYKNYVWSSLLDYAKTNRWGKLLRRGIILGQFDDSEEYRTWVKENPAKEPEYLLAE